MPSENLPYFSSDDEQQILLAVLVVSFLSNFLGSIASFLATVLLALLHAYFRLFLSTHVTFC